jgi:uncharacterized protein YjiS (DUF1127 family)
MSNDKDISKKMKDEMLIIKYNAQLEDMKPFFKAMQERILKRAEEEKKAWWLVKRTFPGVAHLIPSVNPMVTRKNLIKWILEKKEVKDIGSKTDEELKDIWEKELKCCQIDIVEEK